MISFVYYRCEPLEMLVLLLDSIVWNPAIRFHLQVSTSPTSDNAVDMSQYDTGC